MAITLDIQLSETALRAGQSADVTFTFSSAPVGFVLNGVTVLGGTLSGLVATSDPLVYVATFTPAAGVNNGTGVISVAAGAYTDTLSNPGEAGQSPPIAYDTLAPTLMITPSTGLLKAGETATITFTFSETPVGFSSGHISVNGGTLSPLTATANSLVYTATFTPAEDVAGGSAEIAASSAYLDAAGNQGSAAILQGITIQTVRPTAVVTISDASLSIGESATVSITFSEPVTGFTLDDLSAQSATLSNLSTSDNITWTVSLAPVANVTNASSEVTLDLTGVTNSAGNSGSSSVVFDDLSIDTQRPTATIVVDNAAMQAGETSAVTITFSEAVSGFDVSDLSVANGVLSDLSSVDGGVVWTGTLTPTVGVSDATNLIVLDTAGVTDAAGNVGASIAIPNNYQVGYVPPPPPPPPVSEDDVILAPEGGGSLSGGAGDDELRGNVGDDYLHGNIGADTLLGGGGDDIARGGRDNDFVHGNSGDDQVFGDLGDDSVFGGQGDDFVHGGQGNDYVLGDLGRDTVLGGQGDDTVLGGPGDDYLSGDLGDDVLVGGEGADLFNFIGGGGRDVVMDFSQSDGDVIRISVADAADFMALSTKIVAEEGGALIQLSGQTILLAGVAPSSLTAADFEFA